jgi:hypothetical protein
MTVSANKPLFSARSILNVTGDVDLPPNKPSASPHKNEVKFKFSDIIDGPDSQSKMENSDIFPSSKYNGTDKIQPKKIKKLEESLLSEESDYSEEADEDFQPSRISEQSPNVKKEPKEMNGEDKAL